MDRRDTKQREAILKFLKNTHTHPTVDQIYEEVRKEIPNISKGTVYRNLLVLSENGDVSELNLQGTFSRYEEKQDKHYHFRCEKCGRVFDVDEPIDKDLDERIARKTGFTVLHHQTEFRGLCKDCNIVKT
jgi:Fur family transcriptional regulator, peroxide stress response regulator